MRIHGSIHCYDSPDQFVSNTTMGQSASVSCLDGPDIFSSSGFVTNQLYTITAQPTFVQGSLLDNTNGLSLTLLSPRFQGWNWVDGTFIDGTYQAPRPYNPIWINYGIYDSTNDGTTWNLEGYRFRTPMNPKVGTFYANMEVPMDLGLHKIQWLYKKDSSSYATAVEEKFTVKIWGNESPSYVYGYTFPTILVDPSYLVVLLGATATFTLDISGPMPLPLSYQWQKGGVNLAEGGKFSGTNSNTLTISNVDFAEGDFYSCIVAYTVRSSNAWLVVDP